MKGLIHIYCGDGKGKTTAAVGLSVRAAGAGKKVIFTQFFKDGSSSEIGMLRGMSNITVCHCQTVRGFFRNMSADERARAAADYGRLFEDVCALARDVDLLVLDEIISACNTGVVDEEAVRGFLANKPDGLEVVLTGRNPSEPLLALADYVTEMKKIRHPYDRGVLARRGIEF